MAVVEGFLSKEVTVYTPIFLLGNTHKYLIQSQNNAWDETDYHFYMVPGDVSNNKTMVNTTSLFRPSMEWYFLSAGVENGVQYYYIINDDKFLCFESNTVCLTDFGSGGNKFKFSIIVSPTADTYNIRPYGSSNYLNKNTGNDNNGVINTNNSNTSGNTRWAFVLSSTLDKTVPFTVSDGSSATYYQLRSSGDEYYIKAPIDPNANNTNANATMVAAASADETTYWYLEQAYPPGCRRDLLFRPGLSGK